MLTTRQQGMLVCDALNRLPHPQDLAEKQPFVELCCPDCCAPCGLLRDLLDAGTLDEIVQLAPAHHWRDIAWATNGVVDEQWLRACWDCTSRPRCGDPGDEAVKAEIPGLLEGLRDRVRDDKAVRGGA